MSFIGPSAMNTDTFRKIEGRLARYSPPIHLREHIVDNPQSVTDLEVHPLTLQGVDFTVKDPDKLLAAIHEAKVGTDKAFAGGSTKPSDWKQHWAMSASLLATKGIGFREPWRYFLNARGLQLQNARPLRLNDSLEMDRSFAANFGEARTLDMSALHISVAFGQSWTECNIHIDETGIALIGLDDNLSISPNFISHTFNELLLKTIVGEYLPTWFIDRVNLHVLSPEMGYERVGLSIDVMKGKSYKLMLSASCGLTQCSDIDFSKIIKLDLGAMKALTPTIGFTKTF